MKCRDREHQNGTGLAIYAAVDLQYGWHCGNLAAEPMVIAVLYVPTVHAHVASFAIMTITEVHMSSI